MKATDPKFGEEDEESWGELVSVDKDGKQVVEKSVRLLIWLLWVFS